MIVKSTSPIPKPALTVEALIATTAVPRLDGDEICAGCGEVKRYRGKRAESLIACRRCFNSLPAWIRTAFMQDNRRPEGGPDMAATIWQNRVAVLLAWRRAESERTA